jgi:hypothetical protein
VDRCGLSRPRAQRDTGAPSLLATFFHSHERDRGNRHERSKNPAMSASWLVSEAWKTHDTSSRSQQWHVGPSTTLTPRVYGVAHAT